MTMASPGTWAEACNLILTEHGVPSIQLRRWYGSILLCTLWCFFRPALLTNQPPCFFSPPPPSLPFPLLVLYLSFMLLPFFKIITLFPPFCVCGFCFCYALIHPHLIVDSPIHCLSVFDAASNLIIMFSWFLFDTPSFILVFLLTPHPLSVCLFHPALYLIVMCFFVFV